MIEPPKCKKFGIIGTSCAGKTTLAHGLVARLKSYGVLADGLFSQDRRFSFDRNKLETEEAQNWMIANLISKEVDLSLHSDVTCLITDRTPVDLFAYYAYQYDTPLSNACWSYVKQWANTYEALYYLEPLPFQDDGKRPSDEFRLGVDSKLLELIREIPNVQFYPGRHDVLNDVLRCIGVKKPNVKTDFTEDDARTLANHVGFPILIKKMYGARDTLSDYDMWVLSKDDVDLQKIREYAFGLFGSFVNLEINHAKSADSFDFEYTIFTPQS